MYIFKLKKMIPDTSCYFIEKYGIFGSYPYPTLMVEKLKKYVTLFVDLTKPDEAIRGVKLTPYKHLLDSRHEYIHYAISDLRVPIDDASFMDLIDKVIDTMKQNKIVYIHCRGGHGRSGVLVALIYRRLFGWTADVALAKTNEVHTRRKNLSDKMRRLGSPQTNIQKRYVVTFRLD